jgi:hypothetical protein
MCLPTSKDILGVSLSPTGWLLGDDAPQNALKPKTPEFPEPETPPGRQPYREPVPFSSLSTSGRERLIAGIATSARGITGPASTTGQVVMNQAGPVSAPAAPAPVSPPPPPPPLPIPAYVATRPRFGFGGNRSWVSRV